LRPGPDQPSWPYKNASFESFPKGSMVATSGLRSWKGEEPGNFEEFILDSRLL
jgi:hypothetical protein